MERPAAGLVESAARPGFFGKLPARGDFVGRGLSAVTVAALDDWASRSLAAARAHLAEEWSLVWQAAPVWHFNLPPGQCGPCGLAGLVYPSMDKVGRQFPLIAASEIPSSGAGLDDADAEAAYHDALEDVCRHALAQALAPDTVFAQLSSIPVPDLAVPTLGQWWAMTGDDDAAIGFECDTLPDAAQFIRMLQD